MSIGWLLAISTFVAIVVGFWAWPVWQTKTARERANDPLAAYSRADLWNAALRLVYPFPKTHHALAATRAKYANYEPKRMRVEILGWLDFAEREIGRKEREAEEARRSHVVLAALSTLNAERAPPAREGQRRADVRTRAPG